MENTRGKPTKDWQNILKNTVEEIPTNYLTVTKRKHPHPNTQDTEVPLPDTADLHFVFGTPLIELVRDATPRALVTGIPQRR
jgi:hypothetical protein